MEVINIEGEVMGRAASVVAKLLVIGESITIVNSEKCIISGKPNATINKYKKRIEIGDPLHGPYYPKNPNMMFRRAVRGMLPKNAKGREALRKLRVHNDNPLKDEGKKVVNTKRNLKSRYMTLKKLSISIGGKV